MQQPDVDDFSPTAPLFSPVPDFESIGWDRVAVRYIGRRQSWADRLYGSGLTFTTGQTRRIPGELARRLLRHGDLFVGEECGAGEPNIAHIDDTDALLQQAAMRREAQERAQEEVQALYDRIAEMDKDGLKDFALTHYRQAIPKTLSLENMRQRVIELIDQFGAI